MNEIQDTGLPQENHRKGQMQIIYKIVLGLVTLFLLIYLVFTILAPIKTLESIKNANQPEPKENWELAGINDKIDSIIQSTAIINSKLLLTEYDSICFSLNLKDSLLNLVLQGVTIHQTKILHYQTSRIFTKMGRAEFYKYISTPFVIQAYRSTIVKIPIVVKHAPKDTIEANKISSIPQLPPDEYVRYSFLFDKPLKMIVEQEEKPAGKDKLHAFTVKSGDRLKFFKEISSGIFSFRIPEYTPWIKIKIPCDEAKSIFRALPENAALAIEF